MRQRHALYFRPPSTSVPTMQSASCFETLTDMNLKVMLMGESGLGKTTFATQLLHSFAAAGTQLTPGLDGGKTIMERFKTDPDSLCTKLEGLLIPEAQIRLHIKVQVSPCMRFTLRPFPLVSAALACWNSSFASLHPARATVCLHHVLDCVIYRFRAVI